MVIKNKYLKFCIFLFLLIVSVFLFYRFKPIKIYPFSPSTEWEVKTMPQTDTFNLKSLNIYQDTIFMRSYILDSWFEKDTATLKRIIYSFLDTISGVNCLRKTASYKILFYRSSWDINKDFVTQAETIDSKFYSENKIGLLEYNHGLLTKITYYYKNKLLVDLFDKGGEITKEEYNFSSRIHKVDSYSKSGTLISSKCENIEP